MINTCTFIQWYSGNDHYQSDHLKETCCHKQLYHQQNTDPKMWDISFPNSEECDEQTWTVTEIVLAILHAKNSLKVLWLSHLCIHMYKSYATSCSIAVYVYVLAFALLYKYEFWLDCSSRNWSPPFNLIIYGNTLKCRPLMGGGSVCASANLLVHGLV